MDCFTYEYWIPSQLPQEGLATGLKSAAFGWLTTAPQIFLLAALIVGCLRVSALTVFPMFEL